MKRFVNGTAIQLPDKGNDMVSAGELRRIASIPTDRSLVLVKPGGENQMLNDYEEFQFAPDFQVIDQPISERG